MIDEKDDCVASMAKVLMGTSAWRKGIALSFPDDNRNLRASKTLEKLAAEVTNLSDAQWAELKPHYGGWDSEAWRKGLSATARQIGFYHRAGSVDFLVKVLVKNISSFAA